MLLGREGGLTHCGAVAGGRLLQDKFPIANGYAAFVEDSEGNRIGLHSR